MPRIHKPNHCPAGTKPLTRRMQELKPYMPAFFDVPLKHVLEILGVSHHTLDPIRRSLNLEGWPYNEVMRGRFCMRREEIVVLRANMMAGACEPMQRILCRIATCSEQCWQGTRDSLRALAEARPLACRAEDHSKEVAQLLHQSGQPPSLLPPCNERDDLPAAIVPPEEEDAAFWEEIGALLMMQEAAAPSAGPSLLLSPE